MSFFFFFFLMIRRPPSSTRTDTLFPYTTLFRSVEGALMTEAARQSAQQATRLDAISGHYDRWLLGAVCVLACLGVVMVGSSSIAIRSEEHTSELQSLMRISYAVFCLKKNTTQTETNVICVYIAIRVTHSVL